MTTPSELRELAVEDGDMVNENYEPTDREDEIIDVMRDEGRANPYLLRDRTGYSKGDVNTALSNLTSAGWVKKVTRGLYEFVEDPRARDVEDEIAEEDVPTDSVSEESPDSHPVAEAEPDTDVEVAFREYLQDRPPKKTHAKEIVVEVFKLLREHGEMETGDLQERLYPDYEEHYSTERTMWNAVSRYLEDLPGIEKTDDYGGWGYAGDSAVWEAIDDE